MKDTYTNKSIRINVWMKDITSKLHFWRRKRIILKWTMSKFKINSSKLVLSAKCQIKCITVNNNLNLARNISICVLKNSLEYNKQGNTEKNENRSKVIIKLSYLITIRFRNTQRIFRSTVKCQLNDINNYLWESNLCWEDTILEAWVIRSSN